MKAMPIIPRIHLLPALLPRNGHNRHLAMILVPIDFSEESKEAVQYAIPIARQFGARITLLHVTDPIRLPADYGYGPVVRQIADKAAMRKARARLNRLGRKMIGPGMMGETIVLSGEACFEITEAARAIEADLIIIGSHGCDGATNGVGSTAERVLWHAPCPVFVLRKKEENPPCPNGGSNNRYERSLL